MLINGYLDDNHYLQIDINDLPMQALVVAEEGCITVVHAGMRYILKHKIATSMHDEENTALGHLVAPMPGTVVAVLAKPGETLEKGTGLIVIEAMKMEHTIHAPALGIVKEFYFNVGDLVQEGAELLEFLPTEELT